MRTFGPGLSVINGQLVAILSCASDARTSEFKLYEVVSDDGVTWTTPALLEFDTEVDPGLSGHSLKMDDPCPVEVNGTRMIFGALESFRTFVAVRDENTGVYSIVFHDACADDTPGETTFGTREGAYLTPTLDQNTWHLHLDKQPNLDTVPVGGGTDVWILTLDDDDVYPFQVCLEAGPECLGDINTGAPLFGFAAQLVTDPEALLFINRAYAIRPVGAKQFSELCAAHQGIDPGEGIPVSVWSFGKLDLSIGNSPTARIEMPADYLDHYLIYLEVIGEGSAVPFYSNSSSSVPFITIATGYWLLDFEKRGNEWSCLGAFART
jgi:hypothetical protein